MRSNSEVHERDAGPFGLAMRIAMHRRSEATDAGSQAVGPLAGVLGPMMLAAAMLMACGGSRQPAPRPAQTAGAAAALSADALCEQGREHFGRREYGEAASLFDRCADADPTRAYAYYRAGLAYYEIGRTAMMVSRFERFVKLAPDAPERPQVESILETVRR